jgi:hypothetical protein
VEVQVLSSASSVPCETGNGQGTNGGKRVAHTGFLDDVHFVQRSRSDSAEGWDTFWAALSRGLAEHMGEGQERAVMFVDGEDVTESGVTVTRVITAEKILEESGIDGLIDAMNRTRNQLQQLLDTASTS